MSRWGDASFDDLLKFRDRLESLEKMELDEFCRKVSKELAARLLEMVVKRTPVGKSVSHMENVKDASGQDVAFKSGARKGQVKQKKVTTHVGGTLRRGWTGGVNQSVTAYVNSLPIEQVGTDYLIAIENPVEYGIYVEYGHRQTPGRYVPAIGKRLKRAWVPGKFMLTKSERELEPQIVPLIEKRLMELLKGVF